MNKDQGKLFTAFLAVLFGVLALIFLLPVAELTIGFLSLTFGIVAIMWTVRARNNLSVGTSLRSYTSYFLLSLIFIVLFSIWDILIFLFQWQGGLIYPRYFLITFSYLVFTFASYKILYLGKQFGFQPQVKKMKLKKKKK
ncbi:hypothetical protein HOI26_04090 [Candidatus Woesearchaeota archaeon]|nr:hypothetical protein [Candidatus Woesearchaeota archaeon]MBT5740257.1 hypothetical protein [Candidatus Woesearchaeota archaeon]